MTPKEKAQDLIDEFLNADYTDISYDGAQQCALIAVDEIINYLLDSDWALVNNKAKFWEDVKQEIEKL